MSISVKAFAGKNSSEFLKHHKAVVFCIENELSYPKETSKFFKGKVGGADLEDLTPSSILEYIKDGVEVVLPTTGDDYGNEIRINVADIPKEIDEIVIKLS